MCTIDPSHQIHQIVQSPREALGNHESSIYIFYSTTIVVWHLIGRSSHGMVGTACSPHFVTTAAIKNVFMNAAQLGLTS